MKKMLCSLLMFIISINVFANLTQSHWRWRNNDGTETTATWRALQDSSIAINNYDTIRLRMEVYDGQTDNKYFDRVLQYATSANGPWYAISSASAINAFILTGDNSFIANGEATTHQLKKTKYAFVPGSIISNQQLSTDSVITNTSREYEWSIKPTANIQPNTVYYFRAASADVPAKLPSLFTGNAFTAKPVYLSNGGFENDLAGWSTVTDNGTAASFTIGNTIHTGNKALTVAVTNNSSLNAVKLVHTAGAAPPGTYLLRFWALADERDARLSVNIKTAAGDNICSYKIYDRFDTTTNGWQMYQYAFKTTASPVTLEFRFNTKATYYMDDIEVFAGNDPTVQVATQYNWQNNQDAFGWISGDNDNPILLPDGRTAVVFNDSYVGPTNGHSNIVPGNTLVNNMIVVHDGNKLTSLYGGTQSSPASLFIPRDGGYEYWISGGLVENNKLKVLIQQWGGGGSFFANKAAVAVLSLPDLKLEGIVETSYTGTDNPNAVLQDGDYDYIYTAERASTFESYTRVARVPKNKFNSDIAWEWYTNNDTWTNNFSDAKRIIANVEGASVVKLAPNNYVMSGLPHLSTEVAVWFSTSPVGPWINKTVIYNIPQEEGQLPYQGHIDVGSEKNGVYTLSYSTYPFAGGYDQQMADKGCYIIYYVQANLKQLSPFTVNDCTGVFGGTAYTDSCGRCVGGNTGKLACTANPNLALLKPAFASSSQPGFTAASAVDGNYSTQWKSTNSSLQWLYADLQQVYDISNVRIYWQNAFAKTFDIQVSDNATDWVTIRTVTGNAAVTNDITDLVGSGRYLRVNATEKNGAGGYGIAELEVYGSLTPAVKKDITDLGGTLTTQYTDSPSGEGYVNLIDNSSYTKYLTFHASGWVQYKALRNYIVDKYTVTSANDDDTRDPLNWTLQGSDDGTVWTTINTQSSQDFPNRMQKKTYNFSNTTAYQYYRFNFSNNSGNLLQLAEIELFGTPVLPANVASATNASNILAGNKGFTVYPNPVKDDIHFRLNNYKAGSITVMLSDLSGKIIQQEIMTAGNANAVYTFGLKTKPVAGMYLLSVKQEGNATQLKQIMIE